MTKKEKIKKIYKFFIDCNYDEIFKYPEVLNKHIARLFCSSFSDVEDAMMLAFNLDKFKNLDFEIASKLVKFKNWRIDELVKDNLKYFKLTISQKEELNNLINEDIRTLNYLNEIGLDKQTIFKLSIRNKDVHLIISNLNFFSDILKNNKQNLEKLLSMVNDNDFKLMHRIDKKFNKSENSLINTTYEIFGKYATKQCYEVFLKIYNNDKNILNKLSLSNGGEDGILKIKRKLLDFKNNIEKNQNRYQIKIDSDNKEIYRVFFKDYIKTKVIMDGVNPVGSLSYVDLGLIY